MSTSYWDDVVQGWKRQLRLAHKELRETLRDRRTVVTLVLMPLLVYPLLSMALHRLLLSRSATDDSGPTVVALASSEQADRLRPYFERGIDAVRRGGGSEEASGLTFAVPDPPGTAQDVAQRVEEGQAEVGVQLEEATDGQVMLRVYYRHEPMSLLALSRLERILHAAQLSLLRQQLRVAGLSPAVPRFLIRHERLQPESDPTPLATLVPLVLILMTITGAVYPAIDLTAGERERGTLETLMAAPVPRWRLLVAKYFAVLVVALLTAGVNLLAMTLTAHVAGLGSVIFGPGGLSFRIMALVLLLLLLFAGFFAAVLLSITSIARSFKEAQAYLIPLMLVALAPGLLSMIPGLRLTGLLASLPLVNIVLVARDLFQGTASPALVAVSLLTTFLYGAAALSLAAYVFGSDAILYGSSTSWAELWRRPEAPRDALTTSAAWTCTALAFPMQFVASGLISQSHGSITTRLVSAAVVTVLIFAVFPLAVTKWYRVPISQGLRTGRCGWTAVIAGLVLGASLWPLAHAMLVVGIRLGWAMLDEQTLERVHQGINQLQTVPIWLTVATLGVTTGVCEELYFRGALLSAFRHRMGTTYSVLVTSFLFAVFHLVTPQMLAVERFLPSLVLGLVLGTLSAVSRSVFPSIVAHVTHNSFLLSLTPIYRAPTVPTSEALREWLHPAWYVFSAVVLAVWLGWLTWQHVQRASGHTALPTGEPPRYR